MGSLRRHAEGDSGNASRRQSLPVAWRTRPLVGDSSTSLSPTHSRLDVRSRAHRMKSEVRKGLSAAMPSFAARAWVVKAIDDAMSLRFWLHAGSSVPQTKLYPPSSSSAPSPVSTAVAPSRFASRRPSMTAAALRSSIPSNVSNARTHAGITSSTASSRTSSTTCRRPCRSATNGAYGRSVAASDANTVTADDNSMASEGGSEAFASSAAAVSTPPERSTTARGWRAAASRIDSMSALRHEVAIVSALRPPRGAATSCPGYCRLRAAAPRSRSATYAPATIPPSPKVPG
mmetsp:Transcript_11796/g.49697  ORF Transcript_11796/g.49697 Transcript_11796/m.49697 type:complete len:289 (-) Transcript_11796:1861-2727(-)